MTDLVGPGNAGELAAAAGRARAVAQPAPADMVKRTLEMYGAAIAVAPRESAPLDRARVRDALGYVPWTPPIVDPPLSKTGPGAAPAVAAGLGARIAQTALWLGQTRPGRLLARLAPARVRTALKGRLR
jgi:hypothetical protein